MMVEQLQMPLPVGVNTSGLSMVISGKKKPRKKAIIKATQEVSAEQQMSLFMNNGLAVLIDKKGNYRYDEGEMFFKEAETERVFNVLLGKWFMQEICKQPVFYKHFKSERRNVIYQVVLSGNEWDGVYELNVKKCRGVMKYKDPKTGIVAPMITADGDYSVYEFQRDDGIYGLSRYELDEKTFKKELEQRGFVTHKEYLLFTRPEMTKKVAKLLSRVFVL